MCCTGNLSNLYVDGKPTGYAVTDTDDVTYPAAVLYCGKVVDTQPSREFALQSAKCLYAESVRKSKPCSF